MTAKEKYRALCAIEPSIPLFSKDWWLDCVCGVGSWNVVLVEENGTIKAALPYYIPLSDVITMPYYTQTMGPWFAPLAKDAKYAHKLARLQALSKMLIHQLPPFSSFLQNFSYEVTDWLPFYWEKFKQTTRYTYLLPDISDPEYLKSQMSANIRRNMASASGKNSIAVKKGIHCSEFIHALQCTYNRQKMNFWGDPDLLCHLVETCRKRKQGDIWGAYDAEGRLHAAVFIVWQESSAWYLAGGGDPQLRQSGAHSLLLWECIQYVAQYTNRFDFEGSMIPGVERFFREFGAIQTPYFTISKGELSLIHRGRMKLRKVLYG